MSYTFRDGFRLVVPYTDKLTYRVKGAWVGRETKKHFSFTQVLEEHLSFLTHSELQDAFTHNRVLVNHSPVCTTHQLALGQILEFVFHRHEPEVLGSPVKLLYTDENFVAVNKPSSVPVHPIGRFKKNTVIEILREEHPELLSNGKQLKVAHRLDRLVSGVLILARSSAAATQLSQHISQQLVVKEYLARVKGVFPEGQLEVCQPIVLLEDNPPLYGIPAATTGKSACTWFERESLSSDGRESLVRCRPVTGRTHQIRVHLQWLGHPITNDFRYGGNLDYSSRAYLSPPEGCGDGALNSVQWCPECQKGRRDTSNVTQEDLSACAIWLHALCYTNTHPLHKWREGRRESHQFVSSELGLNSDDRMLYLM